MKSLHFENLTTLEKPKYLYTFFKIMKYEILGTQMKLQISKDWIFIPLNHLSRALF